jgi:hypothetical protein
MQLVDRYIAAMSAPAPRLLLPAPPPSRDGGAGIALALAAGDGGGAGGGDGGAAAAAAAAAAAGAAAGGAAAGPAGAAAGGAKPPATTTPSPMDLSDYSPALTVGTGQGMGQGMGQADLRFDDEGEGTLEKPWEIFGGFDGGGGEEKDGGYRRVGKQSVMAATAHRGETVQVECSGPIA